MQALFYQVNPVGWATCKWLRYLWSGCLLSKLNGISLREVEIPKLPGRDWVRVRTILGGICGSDVRILGQGQPANSILQAFSSMPMILGHENVGLVVKVGPDVDASWKRRRVCVEPTLCCEVRGIDPPCQRCREGEFGMCESFAASRKGNSDLPPGTSIGYNSRTGGSFGEYFVAHQSQLVPVPDELSDEQAALTDPVACSLHAVLRVDLSEVQRVLVYGTGVLGLGVIAALRAVGYKGGIDALDRYEYLERVAAAMGADAFLRLPASRKERFEMVAERTGASLQRARFGNYMLSGGYDVVFDCVGSPDSINETLKWTRARGQVALIGTGHGGRVDLTPIWFREVTVIGAYGRQFERHNGRRIETYKLVYELMLAGKLQLADLLTHRFPLREYRKAIDVGMHKAKHAAIKVAFDFRNKG